MKKGVEYINLRLKTGWGNRVVYMTILVRFIVAGDIKSPLKISKE